MKKILCILGILLAAILFGFYNYYSDKTYKVIKIYSPTKIVVDFNHNSLEDSGEKIDLSINALSFSNKELCQNVSKQTNSSYDDILAVGYLADKYAEDTILGKDITIKDKKHICIRGYDYTKALSESGYIIKNNKPENIEAYKKEIIIAHKLNLRIYNAKSNKYHKLSCKYGLMAKDYAIVPQSQLPKNAKSCKFCLDKKDIKAKVHKSKKILPPPMLFSTKYIKIFLNDYTTNLKPSNECKTLVCKEILNNINKSRSSIDIAIYGYDRVPAIDFALSNAIKRGVKIRLLYDIDTKGNNIYKDTSFLAKLIENNNCDKALTDTKNPTQYTNSLMHDKFYIFDKQRVITGSANLSSTDMSGFNANSAILINSPSVAQIYETEFEQMYNGKFHNTKNKVTNKQNIILGNSVLSIYFSPKDNAIKTAILPLVNGATKYIYIPTFLITDKAIVNALILAKGRGVDIKVIIDAANAKSPASKHRILRENGIKVKTENYAGKLHSKSMIIDDKYVIIGSMNFSGSGNNKNDENLIIIKNSQAAIFYKKFFGYLWIRVYNFWLTHDVSAESIYSIGSCSDGIDNDFDGKIDMQDDGCQTVKK